VSGVAIRRFARPGASRVALVGAGVQGIPPAVLVGLLPGAELRIFDRHPERADALRQRARTVAGVGPVHTAADARRPSKARMSS